MHTQLTKCFSIAVAALGLLFWMSPAVYQWELWLVICFSAVVILSIVMFANALVWLRPAQVMTTAAITRRSSGGRAL